ncbi:protein spire homolog 1-like isoform X3 [Parus major]|uniref:protein spire homolog 1-like isoform X3 n=1 Tax=Parus major TaxID=9157 RepID=UPI0007713617|nr:protein spire homolog 1-like isoform X3 [Parus major]
MLFTLSKPGDSPLCASGGPWEAAQQQPSCSVRRCRGAPGVTPVPSPAAVPSRVTHNPQRAGKAAGLASNQKQFTSGLEDIILRCTREGSDVGSIQQSEDKLLEYLGVVIYEALDWGIDSQVERELSEPLEKLLCLMLKLNDEATEPPVTLQDVIKACEEHLSRPSEATSHYEMTCRSLFTEYVELQKLVTIIQTSKERLRKMDVEDWLENPIQKKKTRGASLWPSVICELQTGVRLRKAAERPQRCVSPKERIRSPYEMLLDDIQQKRYTLRKVTVKQKHRASTVDVAALKPHLKPMLKVKLKQHGPLEPRWHEQLMAEIKQPPKLRAAAQEKRSRPKEMLEASNTALNSPNNNFLHLQDASTEFKITNTKTQQLGAGAQETIPKLPASTCLPSTRLSGVSCISTGLTANCMSPPMSAPTPGDIKPKCFLSTGQQQLPPYRGRSRSLERGLQSKQLDCPIPTKWPSPTIAELIGTRYAMMVLEGQGLFQGGSHGVFPRAKICFSCHKQMFLKWPYNCYLCSRVVCCDCCVKMSMPFRMCLHLPLQFLKFLRLSREEDPAIQEQKSSELLREIQHRQYFGVPVVLEPHGLAQPQCCYTATMADWQTADICTWCEQYLLNVASSQQHSIPLRRISWA